MFSPEISIIIPIYNVEDYLSRCLFSVASQTFKSFEVIMVDDISTDSSFTIAQGFAATYSNFTLLKNTPDNKGNSGARNLGIKKSRGKYIAFVDSDDYVSANYLSKLYTTAKKTGADVTCCNYATYHQLANTHHKILFRRPHKRVYSTDKAVNMTLKDIFMRSYLWNKLWKRNLFFDNDIFLPHIYFEDIATCVRLISKANSVASTKSCLYYYTQRKNSIMSTFDYKIVNGYMTSIGVVRNFLENEKIYDKHKFSFWFLGKIVTLVCLVACIYNHFKDKSLGRMSQNLKSVFVSMSYFTGKEFETTTDVVPVLKSPVVNPHQAPAELNENIS